MPRLKHRKIPPKWYLAAWFGYRTEHITQAEYHARCQALYRTMGGHRCSSLSSR